MTASELSSILKLVESRVVMPDASFSRLLTDSRKLTDADDTLFFAIRTKRNNGANYIPELYAKGVRHFIVSSDIDDEQKAALYALEEANLWFVKDVVAMLQRVAECHRAQFSIPVVGITGSNGKTIVKDWIVQLLSADHNIAASPKSYNSQIGVPLSVIYMI